MVVLPAGIRTTLHLIDIVTSYQLNLGWGMVNKGEKWDMKGIVMIEGALGTLKFFYFPDNDRQIRMFFSLKTSLSQVESSLKIASHK